MLTYPRPAFAACIREVTKTDPANQLLDIVCPLSQIFNIVVLSGGSIFVIMVFYSAIKFALSQGDAKAIEASKMALTWAVIGFIIVICIYVIYFIILGILGIDKSSVLNLQRQIEILLDWVTNN